MERSMKDYANALKAIGLEFDFDKNFFYENAFYLTSGTDRTAKLLAHYELFKMSASLKGDIVECGVFKGASFARFIKFRNIFGLQSKRVIGFDTFGEFPESDFADDVSYRENFIKGAGSRSISADALEWLLGRLGCSVNVELVKGDVCETIPAYISKHPELSVSMLNIDVDIYRPTKATLENMYDRVVKGGIIILDDYEGFPGATAAIDEFCKKLGTKIERLPWVNSPHYIIRK